MERLIEIVKKGLEHSIAQTFLIFSSIFVIASLWAPLHIFFVAILTLFYAIINSRIEALRKHESLGRYAVGSYHYQSIRFTVISFVHLGWWIVGVALILLSSSDLLPIPNNVLVVIIIAIFLAAVLMTAIWLWRLFDYKEKAEQHLAGNYKLKLICRHCDYEGEVTIPQKRPTWDHPCPKCGLYDLEIKQGS